MNKNRSQKSEVRSQIALWTVLLSSVLCPLSSVLADITATVYPGYTFGADENPTTDTLNLLGLPTIAITGTLGGTNIALGAGTVSGTMLMDSVVDGVTVEFNGSTPRAVHIKNSGVDSNQIAAAFIHLPLTGGGGAPLFLQFDNQYLGTNASSQLTVRTNSLTGDRFASNSIPTDRLVFVASTLLGSGTNGSATNIATAPYFNIVNTGTNQTLAPVQFVSPLIVLPAATGVVTNMAHGFTNTPSLVRWVIVNQTADNGFDPGDEVTFLGTEQEPFTYGGGANATNVFLAVNSGTISLASKADGTRISITRSRWKAKCYARP